VNGKGEVSLKPLDGRPERKIADCASSAFAVAADGIYCWGRMGSDNKYPLLLHRLSDGVATELSRVPFRDPHGLAVSAEGNTVFYTAGHGRSPDIMLIEGFR
jgi:hypothetical protein